MRLQPNQSFPAARRHKVEMKILGIAIVLSLSMSLATVYSNPKDEEFEKIAHNYVEGMLVSHPEYNRAGRSSL